VHRGNYELEFELVVDLGGLVVFARPAPGGVLVLRVGAALGAGLYGDLGAALEGAGLFEAPMSTFLPVPPLPASAA